jgi:hypothetical protein
MAVTFRTRDDQGLHTMRFMSATHLRHRLSRGIRYKRGGIGCWAIEATL